MGEVSLIIKQNLERLGNLWVIVRPKLTDTWVWLYCLIFYIGFYVYYDLEWIYCIELSAIVFVLAVSYLVADQEKLFKKLKLSKKLNGFLLIVGLVTAPILFQGTSAWDIFVTSHSRSSDEILITVTPDEQNLSCGEGFYPLSIKNTFSERLYNVHLIIEPESGISYDTFDVTTTCNVAEPPELVATEPAIMTNPYTYQVSMYTTSGRKCTEIVYYYLDPDDIKNLRVSYSNKKCGSNKKMVAYIAYYDDIPREVIVNNTPFMNNGTPAVTSSVKVCNFIDFCNPETNYTMSCIETGASINQSDITTTPNYTCGWYTYEFFIPQSPFAIPKH